MLTDRALIEPLVVASIGSAHPRVELELCQQGSQSLDRYSGAFDERVETAWIMPQGREHARGFRFERRPGVRCGERLLRNAELIEHVERIVDQLGALFDQVMAALGERRMDRAGNGEHVPTHVYGAARGDQ